jgi:hypothetical protein
MARQGRPDRSIPLSGSALHANTLRRRTSVESGIVHKGHCPVRPDRPTDDGAPETANFSHGLLYRARFVGRGHWRYILDENALPCLVWIPMR